MSEHNSVQHRFPGLNALRFFAAMFVVIYHISMNQDRMELPSWHLGGLFERGVPAVSFFFTLSGFLITHLLIAEYNSNGRISLKRFYFRRIVRIWPLYFLIVFLGLFVYRPMAAHVGISNYSDYKTSTAIVLYALFLPNLMSSLATVGGILHPTWSIGVEEQFYLAWAPLVSRAKGKIVCVAGVVFVVFFLLSFAAHYDADRMGRYAFFVDSLKFHYMAAGGMLAYMAFHHRDILFSLPPMRWRWSRWLMLAILVEFYIVGTYPTNWYGQEVLQVILYPWLICEIALQPQPIVNLTNRWLDRLGEVSYGIYMYHMGILHVVSFFFLKTAWWKGNLVSYYFVYYLLSLGGTIGGAMFSYRFFERPFLRMKLDNLGKLCTSPNLESQRLKPH